VEVRYWQPYRLAPPKNVLAPLWPPHSKKLAPPLFVGIRYSMCDLLSDLHNYA